LTRCSFLNAVQGGADGVVISGCLPEKCHYKEGNLAARRQLVEFTSLLDYIGYDQERVRFVCWICRTAGVFKRELADFESQISRHRFRRKALRRAYQ
jgi:coenzyme F420-reducing hydrogenase delta subunit